MRYSSVGGTCKSQINAETNLCALLSYAQVSSKGPRRSPISGGSAGPILQNQLISIRRLTDFYANMIPQGHKIVKCAVLRQAAPFFAFRLQFLHFREFIFGRDFFVFSPLRSLPFVIFNKVNAIYCFSLLLFSFFGFLRRFFTIFSLCHHVGK